MIIYYNPQCSKCREALDLLEQNACNVTFREYLKNPLSKEELKELLKKLGCKAVDIVRKSEPLYLEKFADKKYSNAQWINVLHKNPILMERPIVMDGEKAVVGRPPVLVLDLVKEKK